MKKTIALLALITFPMLAPAQTASQNAPMKQFVLIFRQGPPALTEADKKRRQEEVSQWARAQNAAGHQLEPRILGAESLTTGASVENPADRPVTALLFLQAANLEEAGRIAASHPANHFGAVVEVRPWAPPGAASPASAGKPGN